LSTAARRADGVPALDEALTPESLPGNTPQRTRVGISDRSRDQKIPPLGPARHSPVRRTREMPRDSRPLRGQEIALPAPFRLRFPILGTPAPAAFPEGEAAPAGGRAPAPRHRLRRPVPRLPPRLSVAAGGVKGSFAPRPPRPRLPATSSLDPTRGHPRRPPRSALKGRARPAATHPASAGGRAVVGRRTGFRPGERGTQKGCQRLAPPNENSCPGGTGFVRKGGSNGGAATKNVERKRP
jgi:hypothetical protein